uniref:hypothetical protein n=1 Tax=Pseudomonas fluorescens TaxID=294 RepID=UPI0018696DA4|nr:hypothetical protein [Pseudomonas fluorescens]
MFQVVRTLLEDTGFSGYRTYQLSVFIQALVDREGVLELIFEFRMRHLDVHFYCRGSNKTKACGERSYH